MIATKEERDLILEMLAKGRITTDEASHLFDAIERCMEIDVENECAPPFFDEMEVIHESMRAGIRGINEVMMPAVVWEI